MHTSPLSLPLCKHYNAFVCVRGKRMHMVCGCAMDSAAEKQERLLREKRWFVSQDPAMAFLHELKREGIVP